MDVADGPLGKYSEENIMLGLDPGRDKTGFAFVNVNSEGKLLASGIFTSSERGNFFRTLEAQENISRWIIEGDSQNINYSRIKFIALGNGTGSKEFHDYVKSISDYEIIIVNERNTTLEARGLYWKIHRPSLLMRLIPESMRVPARILDDLAAWAIALRALSVLHEKI